MNHSFNSRGKKAFALWALLVVVLTFFVPAAFAATNDPIEVVNNLSDFIFSIIWAIGLILLGFGILQLGLSLKDSPASFDPSEVAGYDVATGTWNSDASYDLDDNQDYAETEQL